MEGYGRALDTLGGVARRSEAGAPVQAPTGPELARPHVRPSSDAEPHARPAPAPVAPASCLRPGGTPNLFILVNPEQFRYRSGTPASFRKPDLERPVIREFCKHCGTQLVTRRPGLHQIVVKVGTLDDPSLFDGPSIAIFTNEMQRFHPIPEGIARFETLPDR